MKRLICAASAALLIATAASAASAREKVILSTDMVDLFDDGVAMIMLAQSPKVDLLGVTTVIGNTWVETDTASALRQLEGIGRTDIPVVQGINRTSRPGRIASIELEKKLFGRGPDPHNGAAGYPEPKSWQDAYKSAYGEAPKSKPSDENAADFIIRQVKAHPGEVTLVSIGTYNNLAAAIKKAPEIVPLVKRVVYMGGAFFWNGNVMPNAEFNIWFDPEAARTVWRTPFKEQVIFPLDSCEKLCFDKARYDSLAKRLKKDTFKSMFAHHWTVDLFKANPKGHTFVWDVLTAAYVIDPSIVVESDVLPVDINTNYGPNYGTTLAYRGQGPIGAQKARIVFKVDEKKVWGQVNRIFDGL